MGLQSINSHLLPFSIQPTVTFIISPDSQKALLVRQGMYHYLQFTDGVAEPSVTCPKLCSQLVVQPGLEFKPYKLIFTIWLIFLPKYIKSCHILITWTFIRLQTLTIFQGCFNNKYPGPMEGSLCSRHCAKHWPYIIASRTCLCSRISVGELGLEPCSWIPTTQLSMTTLYCWSPSYKCI